MKNQGLKVTHPKYRSYSPGKNQRGYQEPDPLQEVENPKKKKDVPTSNKKPGKK